MLDMRASDVFNVCWALVGEGNGKLFGLLASVTEQMKA